MKKASFLGLLVAFALVVAACGDDATPETVTVVVTQPGETVTSVVTSEVIVEAPGSIVVWAKWGASGGEGESFLQVLEPFKEQTGVGITYVGVGDALPTLLRTQVEGGEPPDVAILPQPGVLDDFAELGVLVPIEDFLGETIDADFAPVWRELGTGNDGVLYGLYFKASAKSSVFFRPDQFAANGITPPATWDEWLSISSTLVDAGVAPICVGGADGWTLSDWFENVYLRTAGPDNYDALITRDIPWTDDTVKEALTVMGQLIGVEANLAGGSSGALQMGFGDSVKCVFGDDQQGAMVFEGDFVSGVILNETNTPADGFNFFPFPSIEGSPGAVVGGGDVAVIFNDSEEARALLTYLATPEAAEIWAGLGGFLSPNQQVSSDAYPDTLSADHGMMLTQAELFRFDLSDLVAPFGTTAGSGIWGGLQNWLDDPSDIDGITAQLEADAAAAEG